MEGSPSPINTLVFDALGVRLYAGDSAGRIREYALDVGSIKAAQDQERASDPWDQAALGMLPSNGDGAHGDVAADAAFGLQSAGGGGQDGADGLNRSLRRQATQEAADAHEGGGRRAVMAADMILRPLRGCDDFEVSHQSLAGGPAGHLKPRDLRRGRSMTAQITTEQSKVIGQCIPHPYLDLLRCDPLPADPIPGRGHLLAVPAQQRAAPGGAHSRPPPQPLQQVVVPGHQDPAANRGVPGGAALQEDAHQGQLQSR